MKKLFCMFITICIALTGSVVAFAANVDEGHTAPFTVLRGDYYFDLDAAKDSPAALANASDEGSEANPPFTVYRGTYIYDPPEEDFNASRAVSIPTSYAPRSFYGVNHSWTATNYTWSSYIFTQSLGYTFDCNANQTFKVEFYTKNGVYEGTVIADYWDLRGKYNVWIQREYNPTPYYVKIVNTSGSRISSGAYYYLEPAPGA